MGVKGVPFGYLEFSRAIRGNHAHTCARRCWRWQPAGAGPGSGSLPSPILFEQGLTGMGYSETCSAIRIQNTATADRKPPRTVTTVERFLSEMNRCNSSDQTVATVRTDLPLPERYK